MCYMGEFLMSYWNKDNRNKKLTFPCPPFGQEMGSVPCQSLAVILHERELKAVNLAELSSGFWTCVCLFSYRQI